MGSDGTARPGFGAELRRRRRAAGLSLGRLAELVHFSKGHLGNVESGVKRPSHDLARGCDRVLAANGELVALGPRREATPPPGDGCFLPDARTDGPADPAPIAVDARMSDVPVAYRAVLEHQRSLGQCQPPALLVPMLLAHAEALSTLLRSCAGEPPPDLLTVAADGAEYLGWMFQESGDDAAMHRWTRYAVRLATAAGDPVLGAYADIRYANAAMHRDDGVTTVRLARRAIDKAADLAAAPARAARVQMLGRYRLAQGQALLGDQQGCRDSLAEARGAAESVGAAGVSGPAPTIGPWTVPDPHELVAGWCLDELGFHDQASALLMAHLERLPPGARRARARVGVRLALARAAGGDPQQSCDVMTRVVDDVMITWSATVRHDVARLRRCLSRWRTRAPVQELAPALARALRGSVPAS